MRAVRVRELGGPEVLEPAEVEAPEPGEGQVAIDVELAGVNYADTHQAEGTYLSPSEPPFVPGSEVVGRRVDDGRRVVALTPGGGYAERVVAPEATTVEVPDGLDPAVACALPLQGLTAHHVLATVAALRPGETVVVHAAAGGVGTLAVQLAGRMGAGRVIGVASTPAKRELAERLGADATVDARAEDLTAALREANGGRRVDVVLEMVGGATFDASLAALAPLGRVVVYGMASVEPPTPIQPLELLTTSRGVLGFWLVHCMGDPEMVGPPLRRLLAAALDGDLAPVLGGTYPLEEARRAHADLRGRGTVGKLLLEVGGPGAR